MHFGRLALEEIIVVIAFAIAAFVTLMVTWQKAGFSPLNIVRRLSEVTDNPRARPYLYVALFSEISAIVLYIMIGFYGSIYFANYNNITPYMTSVANPIRVNETMLVKLNLQTETVAAGADIFAAITIFPPYWVDSNTKVDLSTEPTLLVIYEGATCQTALNKFHFSDGCERQVFRNADGTYTEGSMIKYSSVGQYGIILAKYEDDTRQFTKSSEQFIQVDSSLAFRDKPNFVITVILGIVSAVIGVVAIWAGKRVK